MFRRFCNGCSAKQHVVLSVAGMATTRKLLVEQDPVEREREKELRQQVLQKYKGMQIPEMTSFEYGNFSTGGIQAAAAKQAMQSQGFPSFFGGGSNNRNDGARNCGAANNDAGFGGGGGGMPNMGMPGIFRVDWLMLFTGAALMYVSAKILYNQMTRGVDDLDFPLWTASLDVQAKHLLFCVQYDEKAREEMKRDFQAVRQTNPFADFFQWVRSYHPEFCSGNRNSAETSVSALVAALSSTNSRELMALATALRQSLSRRGGDPMGRLDDFLSKLSSNGAMLGSMGSGLAGAGRMSNPQYTPQPPAPTHPFVSQGQGETGGNATNPFEHVESKG